VPPPTISIGASSSVEKTWPVGGGVHSTLKVKIAHKFSVSADQDKILNAWSGSKGDLAQHAATPVIITIDTPEFFSGSTLVYEELGVKVGRARRLFGGLCHNKIAARTTQLVPDSGSSVFSTPD